MTISPVHDAAGTIIGASKIARDVTAINAAERERVRLLEENAAITAALNEVDRDKVVQAVTDAATELTTAEFGAFFYNVVNDAGESYMLYTIAGVPKDAFSNFPMPRNSSELSGGTRERPVRNRDRRVVLRAPRSRPLHRRP